MLPICFHFPILKFFSYCLWIATSHSNFVSIVFSNSRPLLQTKSKIEHWWFMICYIVCVHCLCTSSAPVQSKSQRLSNLIPIITFKWSESASKRDRMQWPEAYSMYHTFCSFCTSKTHGNCTFTIRCYGCSVQVIVWFRDPAGHLTTIEGSSLDSKINGRALGAALLHSLDDSE